jgi:hypothetical protein
MAAKSVAPSHHGMRGRVTLDLVSFAVTGSPALLLRLE